uniref:Glycerophosphodiester phosphodiesterase domain containing 3a n=1 Tax=Nothobranchius furzeri TaxID=105023 RepID=A0A8C6KAG3_NOTFU
MGAFLYVFLPVLGVYTCISQYLLRNPQVLHKKKRTAFWAKHISHRGGKTGWVGQEIFYAVEMGTDMLEMDCHLTKDGHVVVSHDENLLRQMGCDVTISSLKLEDLPLYKEQLEVAFYAGRFSSGSDRKIAQLEDVFKTFPDTPVSIEIKENNLQLIQKVSDLVKRYNREAITLWASEKSLILEKCCKINSSMPYSFSMNRGISLLLLFYSGLLPFVPLGENVLQFYLIPIINRWFRGKSLTPGVLTMRKSLFKHLAARGIQVHLFVCNENEDIKAALKLGATGVMTDYPTLLSTYLCKNRSQD